MFAGAKALIASARINRKADNLDISFLSLLRMDDNLT
jgi:hypothetical protein